MSVEIINDPYKKLKIGRFQKVIVKDEYRNEKQMTFICQDLAFFILFDDEQAELKDYYEVLSKLTIELTQYEEFWEQHDMFLKQALKCYLKSYVGLRCMDDGNMVSLTPIKKTK